MEKRSDDSSVKNHIEKLVKEEHALYGHSALSAEDQARLQVIKVELDQCWDLLRQRRAQREFGKDPDHAVVRPKETVESYEQ
jgi:hypothetical protein